MFIELTTIEGGKLLLNTDAIVSVCAKVISSYQGRKTTLVIQESEYSAGLMKETTKIQVEESYEAVKFLLQLSSGANKCS